MAPSTTRVQSVINLIRVLKWLFLIGIACIAIGVVFGVIRSETSGGVTGAIIALGVGCAWTGLRGRTLIKRQIRGLEASDRSAQ